MQPNELVTAKINATLKILEWARSDIEPGISGTPEKTHVALAEAFRETYRILDEAIPSGPAGEASAPAESGSLPIGEEKAS